MLIKKKFSLILVFCIALSVLFASCDNSDAEAEEISANVITQSDTGAPSGSDTESESGTPAETQIVAVTDSQGEVVTNAQGGAVTEVTSVTEPLPVSALSPDESKKIEELITQSATQATTVVSKSSIADGAKYAYNTLTDDEKGLYDAIVSFTETMRYKLNVTDAVDSKVWSKILGLVYYQEPQLFWLDAKSKVGRLYFNEYDTEAVAVMQKEIDTVVNKLLKEAEGKSSTYDKLKVFHDYLVLNSSFQLGAAESGSYNSSIYSALSKTGGQGNVQCAGYAKAMKYLCDKSGINCMVITGNNEKGDTHAWNIVDVDGSWYNLDVTWDDPLLSVPDEKYIRNAYFLVPDKWIKDNTHFNANIKALASGGSVKYFTPPACTETSLNYFVQNNMVYSDAASAEAAIKSQIDKVVASKGRVVEILCESKTVYDAVYKKIKDYQTYAQGKSSTVKGLSDMCNEGMLLIELDIQYN